MPPLLHVQGLTTRFPTREGVVRAATNISLSIDSGHVLALLGESGSGKTTVGLSIIGLVPFPGEIAAGSVMFDGSNLLQLEERQLRKLRGSEISMIFQNPISGLNPILTVGHQIEEVFNEHLNLSKADARRRVVEVLRDLRIPRPEHVVGQYPFQISGGMAQRVMIGIATALQPRLLIADEPTTALDVTVQAAILDELALLKEQGTAILLITHDMGVVARMADDVAIMYGGRIVEYGPAQAVFERPSHPYTWAMLATRPRPDQVRERLMVIPGAPPALLDQEDECPFLGRCPKALSVCRTDPMPLYEEVEPGHMVACYNQMLNTA